MSISENLNLSLDIVVFCIGFNIIKRGKNVKNNIIKLAKENYIDEIRFIDGDNLTEKHIGDLKKFAGRHPVDIMQDVKTVIVFSTYIGKFSTVHSAEHGRTSRLVLSGYYANIVKNAYKRIPESFGLSGTDFRR